MMETVVVLRPPSEWRKVDTWYTSWAPSWLMPALGRITPDHISTDQLVEQMDTVLKIPGVSNAWTMPIKNRIDMLTTGMRTPVGIKIYGADTTQIERIGAQIEALLPKVRGTRNVFAERTGGGYFLDFDWNRDHLARYGLSDRRRAERARERDRRRKRHHHGGRARALPGERALSARFSQRHRQTQPRAGSGDGRPDAGARWPRTGGHPAW